LNNLSILGLNADTRKEEMQPIFPFALLAALAYTGDLFGSDQSSHFVYKTFQTRRENIHNNAEQRC